MNFVFLKSDTMGQGDQSLGERLLEVFLEKLANSNEKVDVVGMVNKGVYLSTREGPSLEALKKLQKKGARIASCGTCLSHYKLEEKLLIGEVGSMDKTVELLFSASKIISPS